MRESKSKTRKTRENSDVDNSASLQMELELIAVKAKNADLIKAHTRLVQENSEMRNQILSLQAELIQTQAKTNNIESVLKSIEQNMKKCTPNLIDVLNLFLHVSDSKKHNFKMLDMSSTSDTGYSPKTKAVTHTVKPHTVNGTVLNLVPTISLTRLSAPNTSQRSADVSSSSQHIDYQNSLPSTSAGENNEDSQNENIDPNVENCEVENQSFVSRRKDTKSMPNTHLNGSLGLDDDDTQVEEHLSDESDQEDEEEMEDVQRLSTIQEESMLSSGRKRTSLGEVRIYLSRLSTEDMRLRRSQNTSFSSTDANVNDTCLNIETTVIENPEDRGSKRLRADIMVFSPHTNSTRVESDNLMFNDLSPNNESPRLTISPVPAIQSTEVTPSTSVANGTDDATSNKFEWLPTPSMSAMGDIDKSNTKLEILRELSLTPTNLSGANESNDNTIEQSLAVPSITPQKLTRSSDKIQTRSVSKIDDESPRSSAGNENRKRSVRSFVNPRRGASSDRPLTPTIVLERVENITASSVNIQFVTQSVEPKENENPPKKRETRSNKRNMKNKSRENRSKSPKRSAKRKLKDEECESGSLQEKIREIQIRLSNYTPGTSQNSPEPSENQYHERPKRAARPTTLKDASLKVKLRRMF